MGVASGFGDDQTEILSIKHLRRQLEDLIYPEQRKVFNIGNLHNTDLNCFESFQE